MKKFIKKIITYLFLLVLLLIGMLFFLHNYAFDSRLLRFQNKNILVLGDSQTECSVNDEILDRSINLSQSAENNMFIYNKLKIVLEENAQVDTVILNYSVSSIMKRYDMFYNREKYVNFKLPKYFKILDFEGIKDLFYLNDINLLKYIPNIIKYNSILLTNNHKKIEDIEFGSFMNLEGSRHEFINLNTEFVDRIAFKDSDVVLRSKKELKARISFLDLSFVQIKYLNAIIEICKTKKVKLILLGTPIYKIANIYSSNLVEIYRRIPELYKDDVSFYDFTEIGLKKKLFYDGVHLNSEGAKIFTQKLINKLK